MVILSRFVKVPLIKKRTSTEIFLERFLAISIEKLDLFLLFFSSSQTLKGTAFEEVRLPLMQNLRRNGCFLDLRPKSLVSAFYTVFARPSSSVLYQDSASTHFIFFSRIPLKILEEKIFELVLFLIRENFDKSDYHK